MSDIAGLARRALARGDPLAAYDLLSRHEGVRDHELDYLEVLALARLGNTGQALRLYTTYNLAAAGDIDSLALRARLLKDRAFQNEADPDPALLADACDQYTEIYERTGDDFPGINAATLGMIAGRTQAATTIATAIIANGEQKAGTDYFALATLAEAQVVLGDLASAQDIMTRAAAASDADAGARSTTIRQLVRLAGALKVDAPSTDALLDIIRPSTVAMFCGQLFLADEAVERDLAGHVREAIMSERIGYAYGALAGGSDILIAEQLLAAGVELHVILPFAEEDFIAHSVASCGPEWLPRYDACKTRAISLIEASPMRFVGDTEQFGYGSTVAMGMARLRADQLCARSVQLAVWSDPEDSATLTGRDAATWAANGGATVTFSAPELQRPRHFPATRASTIRRGTYAMLFADFPGFSKLPEAALPIFWEQVMAGAADALQGYEDAIVYRNTWGDSLYLVFEEAAVAAQAAIDLCARFSKIDFDALGVPPGTAMRIALHLGSIYVGHDPVTRRASFYGSEVSRAARIEPVTPPGSIYVTEPFAAVLQMQLARAFACHYVGRIDLAKNYGKLPLYRLTGLDR